jgi:drug/metabolite transporter (DMT)-like permease
VSKQFQYCVLLFVVMMWGFNVVATKVLVSYFSPITMTSFRIFMASIVVILVLRLKKKLQKIKMKDIFYISMAALFNVVGHQLFLSLGLTKTSASNTGLILGMAPLITSIFAFMFLGDRLTILRMIGIMFGFTGITIIIMNGNHDVGAFSIGDFYIFLSVLSQGISFILIRKMANTIDGLVMTGWMLLFGSIVLFSIGLVMEPHGLSSLTHAAPTVWLIFIASAVFATGIGHMLYNHAIQIVGAAESAIFINFSPFFALIASYLFLGEHIFFSQMIGFLIIVIGVVFASGVSILVGRPTYDNDRKYRNKRSESNENS